MYIIQSVSDLIAFAHHTQSTSGLRAWFRGHSRERTYKLCPSAHRNYSDEQERALNNEFRARAATRHGTVPSAENKAAWLALAQHYGLPTRLLDWTFSPLIAAYFAVNGHAVDGEDACVWAILPGKLNQRFGLRANLYPLDALSIRDLIEPAFRGVDSTASVAAAMAIESDPRMQVQQGAFTVHSLRTPLCELQDTSDWLFKGVIPYDCISGLRYELKILSIRHDSVFPDLQALAKQVAADVCAP